MYDILNVYLENGLHVVMHKIPFLRTMACGFWVRQGSQHETDETNGLSHLLEHLMINTDNDFNPNYQNLMRDIAAEGVTYNATTTKETTSFYFTGLSSILEKCIQTLASIVVDNNGFKLELFKNEQKVVTQEAISFYSSFNQIRERTSQALWGSNGIGRIIVGAIDNINNAVPKDLENILNNSYTPENSTLVVVGGIDYDKTLDMVWKYFSKWKDTATREYKEVVDSDPGIYCNINTNVKSSVISLGFRTLGYKNYKERINIEIISKILGDPSLESRLTQEIRLKRGLSYNMGGFTNFYKERGTLGFTAVCSHESVKEIAKIMIDEFNKVKETGFTEEEVKRAKKILETRTLLDLDSTLSQLMYLGKYSSYGLQFSLENEIRNIQRITIEDINKTVKETFNSEGMGLALIGDCNIDEIMPLLKIN